MQQTMIELMRDQVHAIYRALTGSELEEVEALDSDEATLEEVERRFIELEAVARALPSVADRVPPFSFTPLLDAVVAGEHLVFDLAIPGVDVDDVEVRVDGETLVISGFRRGARASNGHQCVHAEIPRGPFTRAIPLPFAIEATPHIELDRGVLRVRVTRRSAAAGNGAAR